MFICEECLTKNFVNKTNDLTPRSTGNCEQCQTPGLCFDIKSHTLVAKSLGHKFKYSVGDTVLLADGSQTKIYQRVSNQDEPCYKAYYANVNYRESEIKALLRSED